MSVTRTVTIRTIERRQNTPNGNPVWAITTDDGSFFKTEPDVLVNANAWMAGGTAAVTISDRGTITAIEEIE